MNILALSDGMSEAEIGKMILGETINAKLNMYKTANIKMYS